MTERTVLVLKLEYPDLDVFLDDYAANISRGTMTISTQREVSADADLELVVNVLGILRPIRLRGVVRWVRDEGDSERLCGLEFYRDSGSGWSELSQLVERIKLRDPRLVAAGVLKILVVEDNPHIGELLCRGLQGHLHRSHPQVSCVTDQVCDGIEALARLQSAHYDLLLTDVDLPLLDGETLVGQLRDNPAFVNLPIIAFSGDVDKELPERMLTKGADSFLPKPLRMADLLQTVSKLLNLPQPPHGGA